jgi:hypothetical protein
MPAAKVGAEKALGKQREARAAELTAKAKLDRIKGEKPADYSKFSAQFNAAQKEWKKVDDRISELEATGGQGMSPQALQEMRNRNDAELETAKANIDQARGRPGESAAEAARQKGRGGLVAPQAGGPAPQQGPADILKGQPSGVYDVGGQHVYWDGSKVLQTPPPPPPAAPPR